MLLFIAFLAFEYSAKGRKYVVVVILALKVIDDEFLDFRQLSSEDYSDWDREYYIS